MRIGLVIFAAGYLAALVCYREWRAVMRHTLFRTPWREVGRTSFHAFPASHWRDASRIVGTPVAWLFAALVVVGLSVVLIGTELVFTPRAVYHSLARIAGVCRGWFTNPPSHTPPHSAALAMPRPASQSMIDAVSHLRSSGSRRHQH